MSNYIHTVQYYETDKMGIVHHSNYIRWMEEARVDFLGKNGMPFDEIEEMGIVSPVTKVEGEYKVPTKFPEKIEVEVIIEEFKGIRLRIKYVMKNANGDTVFIGHSEHCFVNKEGRICRVNKEFPEMYAKLAALVPSGD